MKKFSKNALSQQENQIYINEEQLDVNKNENEIINIKANGGNYDNNNLQTDKYLPEILREKMAINKIEIDYYESNVGRNIQKTTESLNANANNNCITQSKNDNTDNYSNKQDQDTVDLSNIINDINCYDNNAAHYLNDISNDDVNLNLNLNQYEVKKLQELNKMNLKPFLESGCELNHDWKKEKKRKDDDGVGKKFNQNHGGESIYENKIKKTNKEVFETYKQERKKNTLTHEGGSKATKNADENNFIEKKIKPNENIDNEVFNDKLKENYITLKLLDFMLKKNGIETNTNDDKLKEVEQIKKEADGDKKIKGANVEKQKNNESKGDKKIKKQEKKRKKQEMKKTKKKEKKNKEIDEVGKQNETTKKLELISVKDEKSKNNIASNKKNEECCDKNESKGAPKEVYFDNEEKKINAGEKENKNTTEDSKVIENQEVNKKNIIQISVSEENQIKNIRENFKLLKKTNIILKKKY